MPSGREAKTVYSDDIQQIILEPPSWLLRWGIIIIFFVLTLFLGLSMFISYPEIVRSTLIVTSSDSPKPIVPKISAKIVKLFVEDNKAVKRDQVLTYLEATGDHDQILSLLVQLKRAVQGQHTFDFSSGIHMNYGELQTAHERFFGHYLEYKANIIEGFYHRKKMFLQKEIEILSDQMQQLMKLRQLQQEDRDLANDEFKIHEKLFSQEVISKMEFQREQSKLVMKAYPLQQTEGALLSNRIQLAAKEREILELENQIREGEVKYMQALRTMISAAEEWKSRFILSAPRDGISSFVRLLQVGDYANVNEPVLFINSGSLNFFGQMRIPQTNLGKVQPGQKVLIKLHSFPYEEYGLIEGKVISMSQVPDAESNFISTVQFSFNTDQKHIVLRNGMTASAEIVTLESSLLRRFFRNIIKAIG